MLTNIKSDKNQFPNLGEEIHKKQLKQPIKLLFKKGPKLNQKNKPKPLYNLFGQESLFW